MGKRQILGTGSGKRNPRPSSRETAMPPHWVSDRGGNCRDLPSVCNRSKGTEQAERTEAGPGLKQIAHRIGPKQKRPTR